MRAAIIYSLIASYKALEVTPREWITDVLTKLPLYRDTSKDLCELLPMNWKNNSNS
ncbi:transposase domain-containing protein [Phocaeicola sp.]|uniref:transposase domain-containing protein n=1 Tax=Phocaeicola sp. TaxID=2773926 RepID=UPI003A92332B